MRTCSSLSRQLTAGLLVFLVAFCQPLTFDTNLKLVFAQVFAADAVATSDPTEPGTVSNENLHQAMLGDLDPSHKIQLDPELFPSKKDQEILDLFYRGMRHAHQIYQGELMKAGGDDVVAMEQFIKAVDADLVIYHNGVGDVEVTMVDGLLTVRVVYEATQENVVFVGSDLDTDHMEKLMARLRMKRSTTMHQVDHHTIKNTAHFDKPESVKEWLKNYWSAIYVKPDPMQTRFAFLTGTVQTILTMGMGGIFYYAGVTESVIEPKVFLMSGLSFVLGTSLAVYGKTLKNWQITFSTPFTRYLKQTGVGLFCKYLYYSLKYVLIDGTGLVQAFATNQPWTGPEALKENVHAHIFSNTAFSNINRTAWYSFPALWESLGKGREEVKFNFMGKERNLGVNYNQLFFQSIYLIPFLMSKMDLLFHENVTLPFAIPGLGAEVPVGRLILLTGMVVAIGLNDIMLEAVKIYAGKKARRTQDIKDIEFELKVKEFIRERNRRRKNALIKLFTLPYRVPKAIISGIGSGIGCAASFARNRMTPLN